MNFIIPYICLTGLFLPLVIFFFNKGYRSANQYLAAFFFFASLFVLENFYFFFGKSIPKIAFFTNTHAFYYLIGPFAFFYMRSILRDNTKLNKTDYLHFAIFVISFIGYIPYYFSSWKFKMLVAENMYSNSWNLAQFHTNFLIPHKIDQVFNVLQTYFYSIALWYLIVHYKKSRRSIFKTKQYKLIQNWLYIFAAFYVIITINFTIAMANIWIYDDKSIFLNRAGIALFFASIVYVAMNMNVMFFPHIMYGLPMNLIIKDRDSGLKNINEPTPHLYFKEAALFIQEEDGSKQVIKAELQLFTTEYIKTIEVALQYEIDRQAFLRSDFKLLQISTDSGVPAHHLTYFFNDIKQVSFTDWRNELRIAHAIKLMGKGHAQIFTMQNISLKCGFVSQNTFNRAFKIVTSFTPTEYLKNKIS